MEKKMSGIVGKEVPVEKVNQFFIYLILISIPSRKAWFGEKKYNLL